VWRYERVELDSLQAPVELTRRIVIDSLVGQAMVRGQMAHVIVTRAALSEGPYDTTALLIAGDSVSQLMRGLLPVGKLDILDTVGLGGLKNMEGWYTTLKFAATVGRRDTIFRLDTILSYDGTNYGATIITTRTRLSNQAVTVPAGTFNAVRFAYRFQTTADNGFGSRPIVARIDDTVWVAAGVGMVRTVRASSPLPFEQIGLEFPGSYARGQVRVLTNATVVGVREWDPTTQPPAAFLLGEAYPNPFNAETNVGWRMKDGGWVKVSVMDILGREVEVLADGEFTPGNHTLRWNAGTRASGTYVFIVDCRVSSGNDRRMTRKVVLVR
jgi:hypothetical protein